MRDEETGSFWQQVSGKAISGPLAGEQLELEPYEEVSAQLWKAEFPNGTVLAPVQQFSSEYAKADWEEKMLKTPTVLSFPKTPLQPRDLVLGISMNGVDRAYPMQMVNKKYVLRAGGASELAVLQDRVGSTPVVMFSDGGSIRAFVSRIENKGTEFYKTDSAKDFVAMDSATGSKWDFRGCATSGTMQGKCLEPVQTLRDYWFDWRQYHPATSIYLH